MSTATPLLGGSARTGVVLLNFGDPQDTLECLSSLERSTNLDLEVVVVDNGPADEAHEALRAAVGARATTIATGSNLGYAAGNNTGIALLMEGGCEFLWLLNPDTRVEPATLDRLLDHLDSVPDCGIVGPRILLPDTPERIWFDGGLVDRSTGSTSHLHQGAPEGDHRPVVLDVDYVTGASILVRRSLVQHVGPIPEQYFLYYEETDWCLRAQRLGWRTMVTQHARMLHHKRSSGRLPQPYYLYYMTRNRYLFARDCLGIDGEAALDVLERTFLHGWRKRVAELRPDWLTDFDHLVALAKADARAGVEGRKDEIVDYPDARSLP